MLETRNLRKEYKTKKGISVTALKGVSLKFPEKGMVFLLGKSGSGKSTLLNLLGGLDKYDDGEIIIKGVSSKDFSQSHFDSYRNTYVGFIFQEYNVLEEFSVGANIALAIELQNRKADDEEINRILKEVDLEGFGDRKPNELSGGQKQRVAIARALVKNPQIIMADEPTGALDSATGKQVFDTLKKLSEDKLVIIVSHDREFAEYYGDRIIELADGEVLRDVTRDSQYNGAGTEGIKSDAITFQEDTMTIPAGYHLTEEDRDAINEYIRNFGKELHGKVQSAKKGKFKETDQNSIGVSKGEFKLIKSKLPLKNAFKIGASGLKHKKIRLAITILLSFVAFSLFALADTFGNYDHVKTCTNSIVDTGVTYASVTKSMKINPGEDYAYWNDWGYKLQENDIQVMNRDTGMDFKGVFVPNFDLAMSNYNKEVELSKSEFSPYATDFSGFVEISRKDLDAMGYKLLEGKLPDGNKDEIAISEMIYQTYAKAGYRGESDKSGSYVKINHYKDLVGKKLKIGEKEYIVTGIVDTKVDIERYQSISGDFSKMTSAEKLANYALSSELDNIKYYSLSGAVMTGEGYVSKMIEEQPKLISMDNFWISVYKNGSDDDEIYGTNIAKLSDIDAAEVTWVDGKKDKLGEKEIIVSTDGIEDVKGVDEAVKMFKDNPEYTLMYDTMGSQDSDEEEDWKVVGVIDTEKNANLMGTYILPDTLYDKCCDGEQGDYAYAVTSMPDKKSDIKKLVEYCYTPNNNTRYKMQNSVTYELDTVNEVLNVLSKVFLYIGIGFAVFAAIMLANFIATSISYKKQEIGILRAIGSRSNDVFRIFFSESFIIAMINFILSCLGTGVATAVINGTIRKNAGILITVLNFGPRQILLLLVVSILVAAVASFLPVYKIASKRPIEAIRNR